MARCESCEWVTDIRFALIRDSDDDLASILEPIKDADLGALLKQAELVAVAIRRELTRRHPCPCAGCAAPTV